MRFVEKPRYAAWAPGAGKQSRPILVALRSAGFLAQIGSRSTPVGNFEVRFLGHQEETVHEIIHGVDPAARLLTVGR